MWQQKNGTPRVFPRCAHSITSVVKREAVTYLTDDFKVSERRAYHILDIHRSLIRYQSKRPEDVDLRKRLRKLSVERRRFGYRRLHVLLAREGMQVNHKKLWRIYKEEELSVRNRSGASVPLALADHLFYHLMLMSVGD